MTLWIDLLPGHDEADRAAIVATGARIAAERGPEWLEVGSVSEIEALPHGASAWIRGFEAAGQVGEVGALTLIRAASERGVPWVCEGLGLQGMAAALSLGAAGVVIDTPAWVCRGSPLPLDARHALLRCRSGRDTAVVDGSRSVIGLPEVRAPQSVTLAHWGRDRSGAELVAALSEALEQRRAEIASSHALSASESALPSRLPLVQGPMANITETPALALPVAASGAMPFAALGAVSPDRATAILEDFSAAMGSSPWGAGVIGFDVMPHRDAHLAAIEALGERGPDAVILAGGTPALALDLQQRGLEPWLHTPSAALVRMALERGVRTVVLEGRDAGGHVGALTSVGLWEEGLDVAATREDRPRVVLAGGISDPTTAAFAAAMAAHAGARGVRVALQAGTAFLFTHEVVEGGQIGSIAQQVALGAERTVLVGDTVQLPLRCAPNAYTDEARAREAAWIREGLSLAERRVRVETLNLGRTRMATRGIERNPLWPGQGPRYRAVPVRRQLEEGAFSLGEGAIPTRALGTVAEVVRALTDRAAARLDGRATPPVRAVRGAPRSARISGPTAVRLGGAPHTAREAAPIAIVGLGCVLPGAPDVPAFWRNLVEGVDAIGPVDPERWPAHRYHDPGGSPSRSVSRVGGSVSLDFDPLRYRIPPRQLAAIDPVQRMALVAAGQAVRDAGWDRAGFDRTRAAVVLGNSMGGEHAKGLALRIRFRQVLAALEAEGALDGLHSEARDALFDRVEARLADELPPIEAESMAGLLANVISGRVASWLDWMGGNLTVDAACAASLASVAVAVDWLRNRRCDAVLAGGADADLSPETFVGFSRTQALSIEGASPFSARADGFTMGEGAAVLALCRLDDAIEASAPVYAVIRGVGQASDGRGRGITAPRADGQRLAIGRAWDQAGIALGSCSLIEAHGTGTRIGDATEIQVWTELLKGSDARPWLGTAKSSIGHLKGAAGAAGLLKATLAVATRTATPTLHAGPLAPELGDAHAPVRLPRAPARLPERPVAGVSAFGFGGTDFHVVLEGPEADLPRPAGLESLARSADLLVAPDGSAAWSGSDQALRLAAYGTDRAEDLPAAVRADLRHTPIDAARAAHRVFVLLADPERDAEQRERAAAWLEAGAPGGSLGRQAFAGRGAALPIVALVPGQGSQHPAMHDAPRWLAAGARALADAPTWDGSNEPLALHRVLVPVASAWVAVLEQAGVKLSATLGHSLGEIGALVAARRLSPEAALRLAEARGSALQAVPAGSMLAVRLRPEEAFAMADAHGLEVCAVNGPDTAVLGGPTDRVAAAERALLEGGVRTTRLEVGRAFHTSSTAAAAEAFRNAVLKESFAEGLPCWSAARAEPMGAPGAALVEAVRAPVRFHDALRAISAQGPCAFVELGPGTTLTGLARGISHATTAIPLDPDPGDGGNGLAAAAAALAAAGHPGLALAIPATRLRRTHPAPAAAPARRPWLEGASPPPPQTPSPPVQRQATPATTPPTSSSDPVRAAVIEAICEVTGYPPDFVDDDAELEGELGIDSIRKLEILGKIEDALGFRASESEYSFLERARVGALVDFARARAGRAPASEARSDAAACLWTWAPEPMSREPVSREAHAALTGRRWKISPPSDRRGALAVRDQITALATAAAAGRPEHIEVVGRQPSPLWLATTGFARSVSREWNIGLTAHEPAWLPLEPKASVRHDAFLLCTGGPAGVLGAILEGLADLRPRVILLCRTLPDDPGPRAAAHASALARLGEVGLDVVLRRCDLTDAAAVRDVAGEIVASEGAPDLVIHAAGQLADGPTDRITGDQIDRIVGPKLLGLENLAAAMPETRWLLLGSVAATLGSPGQAVYAAANAAMHGWGLPGTTLDMTAWSDRGMAADSATLRALERRGIAPVSPDDGARSVRSLVLALLAGIAPAHCALLAQEPPRRLDLAWPARALVASGERVLELGLELDPAEPRVSDHSVGGVPLLPAAAWIVALHTAGRLRGQQGPLALAALRIDRPTRVPARRTDLSVLLEGGPDRWTAKLLAGGATVGTATVHAGAAPASASAPPAPNELIDDPYTPERLFHGPAWQVLTAVALGPKTAVAVVDPGPAGPLASLVDGAHQLLALWTERSAGWLGLPVGAALWTIPEALPAGPFTLQIEARLDGDRAHGDLRALDAHGIAVLVAEGLLLQRATPMEKADV